MMNPIYYIGGTIMSCGFIFVGWGSEGYLSNLCLILGGLYFGHIVTDALNSPTKESL
jgi:hypothetical protein